MTFGKRRNQVNEDIEEDVSSEEEESAKLKINLGELLGGAKDKDPRIIGLFGSVEEEKAGEPMIDCSAVRLESASSIFARPKSATLTEPSFRIIRLAGLMSR